MTKEKSFVTLTAELEDIDQEREHEQQRGPDGSLLRREFQTRRRRRHLRLPAGTDDRQRQPEPGARRVVNLFLFRR